MKEQTKSDKVNRRPAVLTRPLPSFEKAFRETSKEKSPMAIVKKLAITYPYVLLHPEGKGYSYKIIWQNPDNGSMEIVASSHKIHKTKQSCISAIKKLKNFWGSALGGLKPCYDHKGNAVDIKIKIEVKRFF